MSETSPKHQAGGGAQARRRFLLWLPAAVFGSAAAALFTTAFRFLRPRPGAETSSEWQAVGRVSELGGAGPIRRAVSVEHAAGWGVTRREEAVFVLPGAERRVVSAVCPHEGCEVEWEPAASSFLCPCHDSRFDAQGARQSGPAERDLAALPSRVNGDRLEVQFRPAGGAAAGVVEG